MTTAYRNQPTGTKALRPIPEGHVRPPSILWPSEAHTAPSRCANCHALLLRGAAPTETDTRVDVTCLLCSQVAYEMRYDPRWPKYTAESFAALPKSEGKRYWRPAVTDRPTCKACGLVPARIDGLDCSACSARASRERRAKQ